MNLHQFLTNRKDSTSSHGSNCRNIYSSNSRKHSNKNNNMNNNINNINTNNNNNNKRFTLFSNLNEKQKEKITLIKFLKDNKNFYNNVNLMTEQNFIKKLDTNNINLNLSNLSNNSKTGKSPKTINYDRASYVRMMKYFTIKSNHKPVKLDELSPITIPIRNILSNDHRKNSMDNIADKVNFYYYLNKPNKNINTEKKIIPNKIKSNDSHNNSNNTNNNFTFSKNSNESEITFKDNNNNSPRFLKENKEIKETKENKEIKEIKEDNENKENKENLENKENNESKENQKKNNQYQFRIRRINLPTNINLSSIHYNNKILQNIINKKAKKNRGDDDLMAEKKNKGDNIGANEVYLANKKNFINKKEDTGNYFKKNNSASKKK